MSRYSLSDLRVLYHLLFARVHGASHQERLESFYCGQADGYDAFRKKLLHGREELIARLPLAEGARWVDMGGGTGINFDLAKDRIELLSSATVVDLAPSLLKVAKARIQENKWTHVYAEEGDATTWKTEAPVDLITFSYSLTMIPDWFRAIDQALHLLKPGGYIGVVDFYVSRKYPVPGHLRHGWCTRNLWPVWFGNDNVFLSSDHLNYLGYRFRTEFLEEHMGKVPFLPARAPYYIFIGQKL